MMTTLKNPFYSLVLAAVLSPVLFSCQQDEEIAVQDAAITDQLIADEITADDLFEDMDEISMDAASYTINGRLNDEGSVTELDCVSRTVDRNGDLRSAVTLTFSGACEGPRGRTRTGTLLIDRSIDLNTSTYTVSTTFQDFYVNGHQIEGTRTLVYSLNEDQLLTVNVTLTDGRVTLSNGNVITRSGNFTRTVDRENAQITVTGSASGTNRNGVAYVSEITSPLVFQRNCASDGIYMPVQGIKQISRTGRNDLEINFGEGACDKSVNIISEGENRTIEIAFTRN
jgi:hypothetical protein